ncbi:MAG: hypothetical protein HIU92_11870 [Proteobacteria bacterium]|nr:hypothetical protein [Pseudomonadota bacterium]
MKTFAAASLLLALAPLAVPAAHASTHASTGAASAQAVCARAGTDDALRPLLPTLVPSARAAFGYTGMSAAEVQRMTVFRCMDSQVLMCSWGANLPCGKAETAQSLPAAVNWCEGHRNDAAIPAYVTGHDTIYQWACHDGAPVTSHPAKLDARGFFHSYWVPAN